MTTIAQEEEEEKSTLCLSGGAKGASSQFCLSVTEDEEEKAGRMVRGWRWDMWKSKEEGEGGKGGRVKLG